MKRPMFSIITTACIFHDLRLNQLLRCMNSVYYQTFQDFEWIFVDDGSSPEMTQKFLDKAPSEKFTYIKQERLERVIALTEAIKHANGEWICFLDSDDEYFTYSLEAFKKMIDKYPEAKMFNFASLHVHGDYNANVRGVFKPEKKEVGHEEFGGGKIVNGTYFMHRSVIKDLGAFPATDTVKNPLADRNLMMTSPWDFSTFAQIEFPEIAKFFTVQGEEGKVVQEMGNPWGQDFYLFYKYTRKYHSLPVEAPFIIIHHEGKQAHEGHEIHEAK